jgi:hypothetical protein
MFEVENCRLQIVGRDSVAKDLQRLLLVFFEAEYLQDRQQGRVADGPTGGQAAGTGQAHEGIVLHNQGRGG